MLGWLTVALTASAAVAAAAQWALRRGLLEGPPWPTIAGLGAPLLVAAALSLVSFVAIRAVHARLRRRQGSHGQRSVQQLQTFAAVAIAVVLAIGVAGRTDTALLSVGLVGFGLTLALQRPILAVAGWATVFVGGVFREGDRIQVGDLAGDVVGISLFTTELWEVGGPDSRTPGRPTGRIRTVSNAVFLEQPIANSTTGTPVVFDEFVVNIAPEGDLALARRLLHEVAATGLDPAHHRRAAEQYERLTRGMSMEAIFPREPVVLMEARESWNDLRLRYLVDARQAGRVRSRLAELWQERLRAHPDELPTVYPRVQPQPIGRDGLPVQ